GQTERRWNPMTEPAPVQGADAVVHLTGENLADGRWTREKLARIRESRVVGTRNLVAGIQRTDPPPQVLVSASAVGYYGDRGEEELLEDSEPGHDLLAEVCKDWESEASNSGIRTVLMRTATVIGPGGALARMLGPFRKGFGGKIGAGHQWMSWIHRQDLVDLYLHALSHAELMGPVIAASPNPVRNEHFTRSLAGILDAPAVLRIPRWGLRLAFGKVASVLLASQRCRPARALASGFQFQYPHLETAMFEAIAVRRADEKVA
ncbi:MAG TPA: TIGR01777 family oxidoreductase, partial [Planctomycetota bacterium]|nr:TIGR01777 family oxidoreductase [Planctomycetota bacterium]